MPPRNEIDYRGQIFYPTEHNENLSIEKRRQILCVRLGQGIPVTIFGEQVTLRSHAWISEKGDEKTYRVSAYTSEDLSIASCDATVETHKSIAEGFEKRYGEQAPEIFRGVGIVTICTAVFYQYLLNSAINSIECVIQTTNGPSFSSKLQTPDLFSDGFFRSEVTKVQHVLVGSTIIDYAYILTHLRQVISNPQHFNAQTSTIE